MVLASIETMTHETRNVSSIYIYIYMDVEDPSKRNLRVGRLEGMSTPQKRVLDNEIM